MGQEITKKIRKHFEPFIIKAQHINIFGMQLKQYLQGNFSH